MIEICDLNMRRAQAKEILGSLRRAPRFEIRDLEEFLCIPVLYFLAESRFPEDNPHCFFCGGSFIAPDIILNAAHYLLILWRQLILRHFSV